MSRSLLLIFFLVIGLLVLACGTQDTNRNDTNRNAPVTASAEQIGVPECDNFLNAYESCISTKVPEVARPQFQATMTAWRTEWKRLAADPQTKAELANACTKHHEIARAQMKGYGCTF